MKLSLKVSKKVYTDPDMPTKTEDDDSWTLTVDAVDERRMTNRRLDGGHTTDDGQ